MAENPQAFPQHRTGFGGTDVIGGMTLRDYFAGQAIFAGLDWGQYHQTGGYAEAAVAAYEIADAMLAERERKGSTDAG